MSRYQVDPKALKEVDPYQSPTPTIPRNIDEESNIFDRLFGPHQRKKIGQGTYGETFSVLLTPEAKAHFIQQHFPVKKVYTSFEDPRTKKTLVKVMSFKHPDGSLSKYGMQAALREFRVQTDLSQAAPITVHSADGTVTKTYDVRKFIPRVHAIIFDRHAGYACILMEYLNNAETLYSFITRAKDANKRATTKSIIAKNDWIVYAAEKAFVCLWLHGYFHADVHNGNVMIDNKRKRLYIIDFGRAITLTPQLSQSVSRYIQRPTGIQNYWRNTQHYGNQAIYSRFKNVLNGAEEESDNIPGLTWHRNGDFLEQLSQYAHVTKKKRRAAWGLW